MRHTSFHSSAVTGWTESRAVLTSAMAASFGLALAAARLTGLGMSQTARTSTHFQMPVSSVGVGMGGGAHLDHADDLLVLARVIEEAEVAQLHGLHVVAGHEIAHPRPGLALLAARLLHLPRVLVGLRLEQPVGGPGLGANASALSAPGDVLVFLGIRRYSRALKSNRLIPRSSPQATARRRACSEGVRLQHRHAVCASHARAAANGSSRFTPPPPARRGSRPTGAPTGPRRDRHGRAVRRGCPPRRCAPGP